MALSCKQLLKYFKTSNDPDEVYFGWVHYYNSHC
jgi:hypothetical protein